MIAATINALWIAGAGLKALAAWRIARKGIFHRIPILWTYIVISVVRGATLFLVSGNRKLYAQIVTDTLPMMLLSEAFAIANVFWAVTENFPRWRRPGTISLAALGLIGTASALLVRSAAIPKDWGTSWLQPWEWAVLLQRNVMIAMAVALVGVRFLLALVRIVPVHPVARRAADVLCIDVLLGIVNSTAMMWSARTEYYVVGIFVPLISGVINGILWAFWLPAAAEGRELPPARSTVYPQEIDWRGCFADLIGRIRFQFTARF